MRVLRLAFMISLGVLFTANLLESQPAPGFVFVERMFHASCADRPSSQPPQPGTAFFTSTSLPPYLRTHLEHLAYSRTDVPALTITADLTAFIMIAGEDRKDWSLRLCAMGEGDSEAEATGRMREVSLTQIGGTISLAGRSSDAVTRGRADLVVHAPEDAPTTVYSSFAAVEVHDMTGPVRITAPHARVIILNSTGRVDATGGIVDFGGARGNAILNATSEVELKFTATRFQGTLSASAERPVRVLVPQGFQTPFQAIVSRRKDFICRADFCSEIKSEKMNGLYVFTFSGDGKDAPERVHLRSEHATVVIDIADRVCGPWCAH